jgi:hypothetical protein
MMKHNSRANPSKLGADGKALRPEDWAQAWDIVSAALEKVGLDLRAARTAVAEIDARIESLEAGRPAPAVARPAQDVAVDIEAPPGRENPHLPELPRRRRVGTPLMTRGWKLAASRAWI